MAISQSHMKNLIADKELIIEPYDESAFVGNSYVLHVGSRVEYYDDQYDYNIPITDTTSVKRESVEITKHGRYIEPGRIAFIRMVEYVSAPNYTTKITPYASYGRLGMTILNSSIEDGKMTLEVMTNRAIAIYPNDPIAKLQLEETDVSTAAVPVGGIIAWAGSKIPYGYALCDGSNGTPNLSGNFIMGGTSTRVRPILVKTDLGSNVYELAFIMRIK